VRLVRAVVKRAVITGKGGPEVIDLVDEAAPTPRAGEVRIAVDAAGVAFGDVVRRKGVLAPRRPFTPGYDLTGVVDQIGDGVDGSLAGVRLAAMMPKTGIGGYAEMVCMPAERLVRVPDGLDAAEVVAL